VNRFFQRWAEAANFQELVSRLVVRERQGFSHQLSPEEARLLARGIELVVADTEVLGEHLAFLMDFKQPRAFRGNAIESLPELDCRVREGVGGLVPGQLVTLALSPFQLRDLHDAIDTIEGSGYWLDVRLRLSAIMAETAGPHESDHGIARPLALGEGNDKTRWRRFLPVAAASLAAASLVFLAGMAYQEARHTFHLPRRESGAMALVGPGANPAGCWMLRNRGAAWIQGVIRPKVVEFDWVWVDLSNKASDGLLYSDNLAVALRCPKGGDAMTGIGTNEITDGWTVGCSPNRPSVFISEYRNGQQQEVVWKLVDPHSMKAETPHHIRIEDDGDWIRVWWNRSEKPVLEHRIGPPPAGQTSWFTGVYNRERIRYDHLSFVMNFKAE
jgi:hypothetical protein